MTEQNFDTAFARVTDLVADFKKHERDYLAPSYSEQDVRKDFIDKFWIALGWDVNHEAQKNPNEQEVKVERGVGVEGRIKKADYAFLTPNFRDVRFFVEAKKPARNIDNADDYFQTIRYGWNAQASVSVLTDFEQFRVLDCRLKPDIRTARDRALPKFNFHYTDYADREKFAEIYYLFSREAAHAGKLEQFAAAMPKPTGKAANRKLFAEAYKPVDEEFLQELDELRDELARSFKNRNPRMNGEELTEATQRTIDRLVFMRFLEDKLIEPEPMVEKFGDGGSAWGDFVAQSERLNRIYNGIIFKPHFIDEDDFVVDEKVFASARERLAHTNTVYNFNYIPIHVLGSIYERFLGNVIVTTDKRASVAPKPEVRKAGGVYYTPEYIVRYIVAETVGKMIDGRKPAEIAELRFADIACGSGSFLLGVFDELLRYHTAYYNRTKTNRAEGVRAGCVENADGTLRLSLRQKKSILTKNIYGVDLDAQAVEVAQLSLFLRLLEDETTASAKGHQLEFRETMLPDLRNNIKHGNSLIGWDIGGGLFDDEEERKLYPMDFAQAFPEVTRRGGFDAIVGNPPYISVQSGFIEARIYNYLQKKYSTMERISDFFSLFIERAVSLLAEKGRLGYIVPSTMMLNLSFTKLRKMLLEATTIKNLSHLGDGVFENAIVPTCIVVSEVSKPSENKIMVGSGSRNPFEQKQHEIAQGIFATLESYIFNVEVKQETQDFLRKASTSSITLKELVDVKEGIKTGDDKSFLSSVPFQSNSFPLVKGRDIERYKTNPVLFINYDVEKLSRPQRPDHFLVEEKLLVRRVGSSLIAAYDDQKLFCVHTLYTVRKREEIPYSLKYILALVNSKLLAFIYRASSIQKGSVFPEVRIYSLNQLPIRAINFSDKADCMRHDRIVSLAEAMLNAKRQLQSARTDRDRDHYESKCAALDQQIDELVYELYDLTDEERKVIENG